MVDPAKLCEAGDNLLSSLDARIAGAEALIRKTQLLRAKSEALFAAPPERNESTPWWGIAARVVAALMFVVMVLVVVANELSR